MNLGLLLRKLKWRRLVRIVLKCGNLKKTFTDGLARLCDKRQFVDNLSTFCLLFVYFLSTFCPVFVLVLSCFCPRFVTTKTKKLSFVKIFRKKFWICLIFVLKNLYKFCLCCFSNFSRQKSDKSKTFSGKSWQMTKFFCLCCDKSWTKPRQNQDKNKTKSRQNVDNLSTNCRFSRSLAKPSRTMNKNCRSFRVFRKKLSLGIIFWLKLEVFFMVLLRTTYL